MDESPRRRRIVACDACRNRRTKCDGLRPKCSYCDSHDVKCIYRTTPDPPRSRLEIDIAEIRKQLDHISGLLLASQQRELASPCLPSSQAAAATPSVPTPTYVVPVSPVTQSSYGSEPDATRFPFMIIQSQAMMRVLGLDVDTSTWLVNAERTSTAACPVTVSGRGGPPRMFMLQPERITTALAAFSEHVHIWFPIFSAGFSETFLHSVSDTQSSPVESCLAMLVVAIGALASVEDTTSALKERPDLAFFEGAIALLPTAIQEYSLASLQCLVLFAIYQMCLMRPCQAHDYNTMASFRAQNMLRSHIFPAGSDEDEGLRRAYWAILLIESELSVQLDLPPSGIWAYEDIPLPATATTWHFPVLGDATAAATAAAAANTAATSDVAAISPHTDSLSLSHDGPTSFDSVLAYFLAEIAMRRMLQRCTTSVSKSAGGTLRYAPVIATELELQLNEWYKCLPLVLRFHTAPRNPSEVAVLPAAQFLQTQYFACKASIYWPAVYQAMDMDAADSELLKYCHKFFDAYVSFVLAASQAVKTCIVNTWTLSSSLFIISMAARRVLTVSCLQTAINSNVHRCLVLAQEGVAETAAYSPSLAALERIMQE